MMAYAGLQAYTEWKREMVLRRVISLLVLELWSPLSPQGVSAFVKM